MAIKPRDEDHGPAMKALLTFFDRLRDRPDFVADYTEKVAEKKASDDAAHQKMLQDYAAKRIASGKPIITRLPPATKHPVSASAWDKIVKGQTTFHAEKAKKAEARADAPVRVEPHNVTKSNRYFARRPPKKV